MKHGAYVFSAEFSSDGGRILTASWDKTAAPDSRGGTLFEAW